MFNIMNKNREKYVELVTCLNPNDICQLLSERKEEELVSIYFETNIKNKSCTHLHTVFIIQQSNILPLVLLNIICEYLPQRYDVEIILEHVRGYGVIENMCLFTDVHIDSQVYPFRFYYNDGAAFFFATHDLRQHTYMDKDYYLSADTFDIITNNVDYLDDHVQLWRNINKCLDERYSCKLGVVYDKMNVFLNVMSIVLNMTDYYTLYRPKKKCLIM